VLSRNLVNEEAKARYRVVKIQPKWVVTPGKQTNKLVPVTNFITLFYDDNMQRFFNVPDYSYGTIFVASLLHVYSLASLNDTDTF
jgi:hypothetical protein